MQVATPLWSNITGKPMLLFSHATHQQKVISLHSGFAVMFSGDGVYDSNWLNVDLSGSKFKGKSNLEIILCKQVQ